MEEKQKILEISFNQKIDHFDYDKIIVNLKDKDNIIKKALRDEKMYKLYKQLLKNDFMFYMHNGTKSYFIKRKLLNKIWVRKDLIQFGDLFYSIENIPKERMNRLAPMRMVVIFSSMGAGEEYYTPNIGVRCFIKNFPSLQKHLLKNTIIMRIMDANLSHGSHYISTPNYPEFEQDIQGAICEAMKDFDVNKDDVVLYGGSKGGTAALYHGLLGDYSSVSVDPIIDLGEYNVLYGDSHFLKDLREVSIFEKLKGMENRIFKYKKIIIGSPVIPFNYKFYSQIRNEKLKIFDIFDTGIKTHPEISKNTVVEQVTFINQLLLESQNYCDKDKEAKKLVK